MAPSFLPSTWRWTARSLAFAVVAGAAFPAGAAPQGTVALDGVGWQQGAALGSGERAGGLRLQGEIVFGDPSASPWRYPDTANPTLVAGVRGFVRGDGVLSPSGARGGAAAGIEAGLGYVMVRASASHGRTPALLARYARTGRDRLVPALALQGDGPAWWQGPTEVSLLAYGIALETPVNTAGSGSASTARTSLDFGATLRAVRLHRLRDTRHFDLRVFAASLWRYGERRLLDIAIDALEFQTTPDQSGWMVHAALGMSALRLTPVPREPEDPSPGQAVPAARVGVGYHGGLTVEGVLGTFHRFDPSGSAIDRGGQGQLALRLPWGSRFGFAAEASLAVVRRVRVGEAPDPASPALHDWIVLRAAAVRMDVAIGAGWRLLAQARAEASDRDLPSLLPAPAPPGARAWFTAGLGVSYAFPASKSEKP